MAKIFYPTNRDVPCPLLLDVFQLELLDKIIDKHWPRLQEYRDKILDELTARDMRRLQEKKSIKPEELQSEQERLRKQNASFHDLAGMHRRVSVYLRGGREIEATTLVEAFNQAFGREEVAVGFNYRITVGKIRTTISISQRFEPDLSISVEPNEPDESQELFGALSNWASSVEAPKWQQKWRAWRDLFHLLLSFWLVMGLVLVPFINWSTAGEQTNKAEARKLLVQGVNPNNQQRAVELLLAIASNYNLGSPTPSLGWKYWTYFVGGLLLLTACASSPTYCLGVWRGRERLRFWHNYITFLSVTVPGLIGTMILLPWLLYWLHLTPPGP